MLAEVIEVDETVLAKKSGQRLKMRTLSGTLVNDLIQEEGKGRDASKGEKVIRKL